jgi:hypothetical protein
VIAILSARQLQARGRELLALAQRPYGPPVTVFVVGGCVVVAALSLLAPSFQTADPWSWIVWGREVTHLDLDTRGGPSWKPFPVLFTAIFSVFGPVAPDLWLIVARAGGLFALYMAFRLARRFGGVSAGVCAVIAICLTPNWLRYLAHGDSEPILVALVLAAIELHLKKRWAGTFVLGFFAALIRPEVWPFFGVYGLWLARRAPDRRRLVGVLCICVGALWFGGDFWGSQSPVHGAQTAHNAGTSAGGVGSRVFGLFGQALRQLAIPVGLLALFDLAFAVVKRLSIEVWLGAIALGWIGVVACLTALGYPGDPRFVLVAVVIASVLFGIGATRFTSVLSRRRARIATWSVVAVACLAGWSTGTAQIAAHTGAQPRSARLYDDLVAAIDAAGGPKAIQSHGTPILEPPRMGWLKPAVAWHLNTPIKSVRAPMPGQTLNSPFVVFTHDPASSEGYTPPPQASLLASNRNWRVFVVRSGTYTQPSSAP